MIKARHKKFWVYFFNSYIPFILKKDFNKIIISEKEPIQNVPESSLLILCNHFSWWDGFFVHYLNQRVFNKKFHVMMLEEELRIRPVFIKAGAYSVRKNSREVIESLNYTTDLLSDPENMVLLFPQGKICPGYPGKVKFEKGISRVLEKMPALSQIIFCHNITEYFSNRKPTLITRYGKYEGERNMVETEMAYNEFFNENLQRINQKGIG